MLSTGIKAPDFSLSDQNGETRSLSDFAGRRLLLYFYPKDNTGGCSKQAEGYAALMSEFEALGITVAGVSRDSAASHRSFIEKHGLNFTLLCDPERIAHTAYDVWKEKKMCGKVAMGTLRTTYLIDENGVIVYANDRVKAAEDAANMLGRLKGETL